MITAVQVRMARAALGLSIRALAEKAGVGEATVERFESGRGDMRAATLARVEAVLTAAGVQFLAEDASGGAGIRAPRELNSQ